MTSLFDLFKIGIGPSSSHTVGPMRAARRFCVDLEAAGQIEESTRIMVELFGSLALTGHGHGTDRAILLGLLGEQPDQIDPAMIDGILTRVRTNHQLSLLGKHGIRFDEPKDLLWHRNEMLPGHSNGMRYTAFAGDGSVLT